MKHLLATLIIALMAIGATAQETVIVDMQYVMKAIPAFETANEQIETLSKKWEAEVEEILVDVQNMYKNYQTELVFLSDDQKRKREDEILSREQEAEDLKRKYFGTDGELFKKREALLKPIQDEIFNAAQELSKEKGYDMILDKASSRNIIYSSPKLDISDELLEKLGYSK